MRMYFSYACISCIGMGSFNTIYRDSNAGKRVHVYYERAGDVEKAALPSKVVVSIVIY